MSSTDPDDSAQGNMGHCALTLQNVVEAGGRVSVCAPSNAVQLSLQAPRIAEQPHLQLRHRHTLICAAAEVSHLTVCACAPHRLNAHGTLLQERS